MSLSDTTTQTMPASVGHSLYRARKPSRAQAERAVGDEKIGSTRHVALPHLRDGLAATSGGIACARAHDSGATTRMLDQFEECGFVARQPNAMDRRVVNPTLTLAGRGVADRMAPRLQRLWSEPVDLLETAERTMPVRLLQRRVERRESRTAAFAS